jgi:quinoprotein dehydrogenase-associated probable ABC transporter substrate-binding protein
MRPVLFFHRCVDLPFLARALVAGVLAGFIWQVSGVTNAHATTVIEAVDRDRLRVCADPNNLPFSNKAGEGFENKIAELLAEKLDRPLVYSWFPQIMGFVRNTLNAKKCDLIIGVAAGNQQVLNTNPYYRTAYVMVYRKDSGIEARSIADLAQYEDVKIGSVISTPPNVLMAQHGLMDRIYPYNLTYNTLIATMGEFMIDDLKEGVTDVALMWGPIAGHFVRTRGLDAEIVPIQSTDLGLGRMDYFMSMGVREGEINWKHAINALLRENRDEINAILLEYGVPLLKMRGEPTPLAQKPPGE